ncbi:hypothetical protein CIB48_g4737 [Xylaria polymorpha]|nr:hypothetical protein CIB48_g4737 [Xylaria polymorpha]
MPPPTASSYFQQPPEVLLIILSGMDHTSRLETAIAYPEVFLRPGFNVFLQDAEDQVRRQQRHPDPTVPLVIPRSSRPLLYTAIDNNMDIAVIENLLRVYIHYCPTSIDGIWGQALTTLPSFLTYATTVGRPQVVSLLLDWGADPLILCGPRGFTAGNPVDCSLADFSHAQCQPLNPGAQITGTTCITALGAALLQGIDIRSRDSQHEGVEECALILYRAGLPIPSGGNMLSALALQLYFPIRAGFRSLVEDIIDPLIPLRRTQRAFQNSLYYGLTLAVNFQKSDDFRPIIDYLLGIGCNLVKDLYVNQIHKNSHAHVAYSLGHLRTATLLLERYFATGRIRLDFTPFRLYNSPDLMPFVQALYRAMSVGGSVDGQLGPMRMSGDKLQESLLAQVIIENRKEAVEWLVDQGVGTLTHVFFAILRDKNEALGTLVRSGLSINESSNLSPEVAFRFRLAMHNAVRDAIPETPLNLALRVRRWEMACYLIYSGADPALVADAVKEMLLREFEAQYNVTYAYSRQQMDPDTVLQPGDFAAYDEDRKIALFYYVLG